MEPHLVRHRAPVPPRTLPAMSLLRVVNWSTETMRSISTCFATRKWKVGTRNSKRAVVSISAEGSTPGPITGIEVKTNGRVAVLVQRNYVGHFDRFGGPEMGVQNREIQSSGCFGSSEVPRSA